MENPPNSAAASRTQSDVVVTLLPADVGNGAGADGVGPDPAEESATESRVKWSSKREYLLTAIGFCVGLGNLWRFPYLCQQNGGGAFLIPYVASLVLCGLPLYFLEAALGQFSARSAAHVWAVCPLLKGAGTGMNITSLICFWYYNTILAWALYYLVASCQSEVPWSRCDGWWNTPQCSNLAATGNRTLAPPGNDSLSLSGTPDWTDVAYNSDSVTGNSTRITSLEGNVTSLLGNVSHDVLSRKRVSAAEEFWQYNVLRVSGGWTEPGHVVWYLALGLLRQGCWTLRDSILLTFICEGTSVYGGFAIFSVLGYMAHQSGVPIEKVVSSADDGRDVSDVTGGVYVFQLVDWYMASVTLFFIGLLECIVIAWVYGTKRFGGDIELMIGRQPPLIISLLWRFVTPSCLFVLLVSTLALYTPPTYGDYGYDVWGMVFGWLVAFVSFAPIPVVAVYQLLGNAKGTLLQRLRQAVKPERSWGPADPYARALYRKQMST
ncbi:hypothetical protein BaRGS_00009797 [Batillaria attramentaria]|uniref:Transporter n=1 Tax=Batillaria attramentaria TaxID=370345 RepID=A0ABD0LIK3_9CAEN